jgi:protein gp37
MGKNSKIEWTDHTFNAWIGCAKVSPGCANCYAETLMDTRYGRVEWGINGTRVKTSERYWQQPLKWDQESADAGVRARVFCGSLCDVFEDRYSLIPWRNALYELIEQTPNLDWLLLTKRPGQVRRLTAGYWLHEWPSNAWLGASIEDQYTANRRIPQLVESRAQSLFLSVEPLLGRIDLGHAYPCGYYCDEAVGHVDHPFVINQGFMPKGRIDWVIAGCESGPNRRHAKVDWFRRLRDQCDAATVPFFLKQMDRNGKIEKLPELDGRVWAEFPQVACNA